MVGGVVMVHRKNSRKNKIAVSLSDKTFYILNSTLLWFALIVTLYPIMYTISASFSSSTAVRTGQVVIWPVDISLAGYIAVFRHRGIMLGFYNSAIYAIVGTLINLSLTLVAAFALSRREMVGVTFFSFTFAFTMWFGGGMIPNYLLIRDLGMLDTRWALWIPGAIGVWNVIVTRTFFQTSIPEELYESATIDGCRYFRYFTSIVLPLSGAIIAVISLFYAINHWNAFFNAFLYLNNRRLFPLQIVLRDILIKNTVEMDMLLSGDLESFDYGLVDVLKYSLIIVACVPVWCIYPFVQKYFVKGIMLGAIKG